MEYKILYILDGFKWEKMTRNAARSTQVDCCFTYTLGLHNMLNYYFISYIGGHKP